MKIWIPRRIARRYWKRRERFWATKSREQAKIATEFWTTDQQELGSVCMKLWLSYGRLRSEARRSWKNL